ncbi:hypothetical protein PSEHALCIP103_03170 [Pseudoalteromonas haloplanktis]|uniref:Uncharacterized protein n=1 Tax=Pseudoalteromonas haloplanktis TaxID=228 RepID=A0A9W4R317_PSEHA|nr:hypothetical protein [Pseudoalteromonas haloplanktis]CAH9064535.1 hypothetical protein PSEHALCIP103_03170 [Pseudoalteromonas haloplanktis]
MSFFSSLFKAVATAASAVINVAVETTKVIVEAATEAWQEVTQTGKEESAKKIAIKAEDELVDINDELVQLKGRYQERGYLSEAQKRRAEYLSERRNELKTELADYDELNATKDLAENNEQFEHISIDDEHAHIIQGNVGVSTFGKQCPTCNRDMVIQWPRHVTTAGVNDFFWGCSGWYHKLPNGKSICQTIIPLSKNDLDIFAKIDTPESQITNSQLSELTLLPAPQKIIIERMEDLRSDRMAATQGVDDYRCPVHGQKLILRRKQNATGLLDQYFLGCPNWKPNDQGCNYLVKLKSPMQLTTLLKQETGTGIL